MKISSRMSHAIRIAGLTMAVLIASTPTPADCQLPRDPASGTRIATSDAIDWLNIFDGFKLLKPGQRPGEYLLRQEIQLSLQGRPQGLILHSGTLLRTVADGRILVAHTKRGNADALIPTFTITYVAIPDPKQNPDDPEGKDVLP